MNEIGKILKNLRINKKMTQKELGRIIGKSERTIQNYEAGIIKPINRTMEKLCKVLECRINITRLNTEIGLNEISTFANMNTLSNEQEEDKSRKIFQGITEEKMKAIKKELVGLNSMEWNFIKQQIEMYFSSRAAHLTIDDSEKLDNHFKLGDYFSRKN